MDKKDDDVIVTLGKLLAGAGWKIVKFEDLGGGVQLTITPLDKEKAEKE